MKRLIRWSLPLVLLAGCQTTANDSSMPLSPDASTKQGQLVILLDVAGEMHLGQWVVVDSDLPAIVQQRHITSAVVHGQQGVKFSEALKAQSAIKAAGVADVTIDIAHGGG